METGGKECLFTGSLLGTECCVVASATLKAAAQAEVESRGYYPYTIAPPACQIPRQVPGTERNSRGTVLVLSSSELGLFV